MPLEKPDIFNALCVYREIGLKFGRLEIFEKALQYFDRALQRNPDDIRALKGRATCRAQACKYNDALRDIATLVSSNRDNIYILSSECLLKYLCCEFEQAMIENLRMIPTRKKPENFVLGAMHCEEAIQNTVGQRAGHPLRDHFRIIRKLAWLRVFEKSKPYQPKTKHKRRKKECAEEKEETQLAAPKGKLAPPEIRERRRPKEFRKSVTSVTTLGSFKKMDFDTKDLLAEGSSIIDSLHSTVSTGHRIPPLKAYPFSPIQRYTSNIQNLMAQRYLDKMYEDKIFLQKLKSHIGVISPNAGGAKDITGLAKKSSKYINYSQELLRARRPFYLLRLQDGKAGGKLRERQLERERRMTKYCEGEAQNLLERLKLAIANHNFRLLIETSEKMFCFCENTPKKSLPHRNDYLQELYVLVRDGFYKMKSIRTSMTEEQKQVRIAIILGMPTEKQGSTDSLITQFKDYFVDKKKQCQIFEERVRKSRNREELVWLYHELSRLHFEQKQYELSKAYGTKCLRESYLLKDSKWIINAMFLMIKVHVTMRNKNGAKIELRSCRKIAKRIEDGNLDDFLAQCIKVVNDTPMDVVPPIKMLEIRTNNIMKLMRSDSMRKKAAYVFQRISSLPPRKRMSVLPGIVYPTNKRELKSLVKEDDKTIKPLPQNQDRNIRPEGRRGVNFLELL